MGYGINGGVWGPQTYLLRVRCPACQTKRQGAAATKQVEEDSHHSRDAYPLVAVSRSIHTSTSEDPLDPTQNGLVGPAACAATSVLYMGGCAQPSFGTPSIPAMASPDRHVANGSCGRDASHWSLSLRRRGGTLVGSRVDEAPRRGYQGQIKRLSWSPSRREKLADGSSHHPTPLLQAGANRTPPIAGEAGHGQGTTLADWLCSEWPLVARPLTFGVAGSPGRGWFNCCRGTTHLPAPHSCPPARHSSRVHLPYAADVAGGMYLRRRAYSSPPSCFRPTPASPQRH